MQIATCLTNFSVPEKLVRYVETHIQPTRHDFNVELPNIIVF
jgi:hypothetical protein